MGLGFTDFTVYNKETLDALFLKICCTHHTKLVQLSMYMAKYYSTGVIHFIKNYIQ